ncbi:CRISPR-associated endonuclease Cas2 [Pinisolibacter sp.]|uniref:CRISPR-associated endonuclease Cas2 n=1 Tax=Pinisolibacter sp. TaxID=2172024 RepID=UPI002FDDCFB0
MGRDTFLRVLCYDVTSDQKRRRIAKVLEEGASRVQYSVFETRLTGSALDRLIAAATAHLGPGDSLRVYTIDRAGERHCTVHGSGVPIETEADFWLL